MSHLKDDRIPLPALHPLWRGLIAAAPTDIDQRVSVRIPDMNQDLVFPNVRWQTRDAVTLPQRGDSCLVAFDNDHEPWVIAWWPFA